MNEIPQDFSQWTLDHARRAVDEAIDNTVGQQGYEQNAAFVEDGDHWQDGKGWIGPDGGKEGEVRNQVLKRVKEQFTPVDAIKECLDRSVDALLKTEANVDFVPMQEVPEGQEEEAKAEADEMRSTLAEWWNAVGLWDLARQATKRSRWASRGSLRLWVPPGKLVEGKKGEDGKAPKTLPTGLEFSKALEVLHLTAPTPDTCHVYRHPDTQQDVAIFLFHTGQEQRAEIWWKEGGNVLFRVLTGQEQTAGESGSVLGLGQLPIAEMTADVLVTDAVRRQQRRLNFAESSLVRVMETAGFPERYTLNAEPHGLWLEDPPMDNPGAPQRRVGGKDYYFHPQPMTLGAAITTQLIGVKTRSDVDGREVRATPSVIFRDPTDPEYAIKAAKHARSSILESCRQGHIAIAGEATASGWSREQARADFEDDLDNVKTPLEAMLRNIIECAISWAESMSAQGLGRKGFLDRFRVTVTLHVDPGPIDPEAVGRNNESVKAGTLSKESAMARAGIEDVEAEVERVESQPESVIGLRKQQFEAIESLMATSPGFTLERAAKASGIDDEELLKLFDEADAAAKDEKTQTQTQDDEIDAILAGTAAAAS